MPARAFFETSRWLRAGLLLLPLLMGIALVGAAWSNRQRTYEASELLIRGQVDWFLRSLGQSLRAADGPPDTELLSDALEELKGEGLRYVALLGEDGTPGVSVGSPKGQGPVAQSFRGPPRIAWIDHRIQVTARFPIRRLRRSFASRQGPRFDVKGAPSILALEFEPVVAERLRSDADRAFALSAVTAAVLMLIASMLWRQLRRRELQAESVERERRLAQLGEMSAVLAHEMRNPLASLKGHAQLLLEQLPREGREAKKAERIVNEATRLEVLSRTLLDFVRSGSVERQPLDVEALVQQAVDEVGAARVDVSTQGTPRNVLLDPVRMNQVLVNLIDNAVQVSSEHGIEVTLVFNPKSLGIEVRDHGPGLEPGAEQKVFEAFHTSKTHGTGLGLAIARRIVELHGGSLTAKNHPEGGAVFHVGLPG